MIDLSELFYRLKTLPFLPRLLLLSLGGLLILGLLLLSVASLIWPAAHHPSATSTHTSSNPATISPLLFGTNLRLQDARDQVLTSTTTRNLLQQLHPQSMRLVIRPNLSETSEIQAALIIKNLGAVPVISLPGPSDSHALADDRRIITAMNTVFGTRIVYYEFDNEVDLLEISASTYTTSWNAIVPQLKALAPHAHFVGPVTYHYASTYLQTFLQQARPRPDEVSWHEYTCVSTDPQSACLSHLDDWTLHINSARTLMKATLGSELPIIISEWNYAPDANAHDGKSNDAIFISTWTQKAFETLFTNQVFASMQYTCTDTATSLISKNNTLTVQGQAFQNQYKQAMSLIQQLAQAKKTPSATATVVLPITANQGTPTPSATNSLPVTTDQGTPSTASALPVTADQGTLPPSQSQQTTSQGQSPVPTPTSTTLQPTPTLASTTLRPTPTPTPRPTPKPTPKPAVVACPASLQSGSSGSLVKTLQSRVNGVANRPYNYNPPLAIDGQFGPMTRNAVMDYQAAHGLSVDGGVGPQTWHSLGYC